MTALIRRLKRFCLASKELSKIKKYNIYTHDGTYDT